MVSQIAKALDELDNLITFHQREFETWKKIKIGYLQRMFV